MALQRIVVIGTSGSGKTSLSRELSRRLGIPHIELDALHWGPGWTETPTDVFRARVSRALERTAWVVDGNYAKARDIVWPVADTIVWLDFPLTVVLRQVFLRTLRRMIVREELLHGNREQLRTAVSRDSIILWALRTHGRHRREYTSVLDGPEYGHLAVVRLRSPQQARLWLSTVPDVRVNAAAVR
ncbi:MAG TPA: adenylate kinase [bacterium]|nr:adenylate kinase [bacterium]